MNNIIIEKIKENISLREKECSSFSFNVLDDNKLEIFFTGDKKIKEKYEEYFLKIKDKVRRSSDIIEENEKCKYLLKFNDISDLEIFLRIRIIENKSLKENLLDWSEGSIDLYNFLELLYDNGIKTFACCKGHGENSFPYVGIIIDEENTELLKKYLSKKMSEKIFFGINKIRERKQLSLYNGDFKLLKEEFKQLLNTKKDNFKNIRTLDCIESIFKKINETEEIIFTIEKDEKISFRIQFSIRKEEIEKFDVFFKKLKRFKPDSFNEIKEKELISSYYIFSFNEIEKFDEFVKEIII